MNAKPVVIQLFRNLLDFGVINVVCSPGSRNAALLQEVNSNKQFKSRVVVDERTAGFIALGIAMVSRTPVALVCTSGTALLNYAPAVAEAYYQGLPLIVISADRPVEWIDQDDSQTIRQYGVFSNFIKASYDINGDDCRDDYFWYANRVVSEGLIKAQSPKEGPIHFNVHLDGVVPSEISAPTKPTRKIEVFRPSDKLDNIDMKYLADLASWKKIMFVAGFIPPDHKMQKSVSILEALPNVCIMAETLSNLHLPKESYNVDRVLFKLSDKDKASLSPEIVISVGGALISRKLKEYLRQINAPHWIIGHSDNVIDCFKSLSFKIECSPVPFVQTFAKLLSKRQKESIPPSGNSSFKQLWNSKRKECEKSFANLKWCDLKALHTVFSSIPSDINLFLSNGTCVRYGQIIPHDIPHAIYSNRGTSGIEGVTSTAVGAGLVYGKITCLVTGDMSFIYDIGALSSGLAGPNMRIIVLNNGGGDIFRFIEATRNLCFREKFLCVKKDNPLEMIAATFGWSYFYADDEVSLKNELEEFFAPSLVPALLNIDTSKGIDNAGILRNFLT